MRSTSKYLEQFDRVKRWYQRFVEIDKGRAHDRPSDYYQDEILAFFINCYHLKDWIKHDESVGAAADKVEGFINNNAALSLCAEICAATKHLKLDKERPRHKQGARFGKIISRLAVGGTPTTISVKYSIDTLRGPVDAFELATKCLEAWKDFIRDNINDKATV